MADPKRNELHVRGKRAVLAGITIDGEALGEREPLEELRGLADTAQVKVVGSLVQSRDEPDPRTFLGRGKVDELKELATWQKAEVVIVDASLSPGQMRRLEELLEMVVVDRC